MIDEKIDEKWDGRNLPIYNTLKRKGFSYWAEGFGTFNELVPLLLVNKILKDKDREIAGLKSKLYENTTCKCGDKFSDHEPDSDNIAGDCTKCDCNNFIKDESKHDTSSEKMAEKMDKAHDLVEIFNKSGLKNSQISTLVQLHELLKREGRES